MLRFKNIWRRNIRKTNERRTQAGYKLRVYMDQIKIVEAMTQEEWIAQSVEATLNAGLPDWKYFPKDMWLAYLKESALEEAKLLAVPDAA
jgi:hypothetical protein